MVSTIQAPTMNQDRSLTTHVCSASVRSDNLIAANTQDISSLGLRLSCSILYIHKGILYWYFKEIGEFWWPLNVSVRLVSAGARFSREADFAPRLQFGPLWIALGVTDRG